MYKILNQSAYAARIAALCVARRAKSIVKNPRVMTMLAFLFVFTIGTFAADNGVGYEAGTTAMTTVTEQIKKYIPLVRNLCYVIAAIITVIGAITIVIKMNNGEQDIKKSIMMTVGSCILFVAAAIALPAFFGL